MVFQSQPRSAQRRAQSYRQKATVAARKGDTATAESWTSKAEITESLGTEVKPGEREEISLSGGGFTVTKLDTSTGMKELVVDTTPKQVTPTSPTAFAQSLFGKQGYQTRMSNGQLVATKGQTQAIITPTSSLISRGNITDVKFDPAFRSALGTGTMEKKAPVTKEIKQGFTPSGTYGAASKELSLKSKFNILDIGSQKISKLRAGGEGSKATGLSLALLPVSYAKGFFTGITAPFRKEFYTKELPSMFKSETYFNMGKSLAQNPWQVAEIAGYGKGFGKITGLGVEGAKKGYSAVAPTDLKVNLQSFQDVTVGKVSGKLQGRKIEGISVDIGKVGTSHLKTKGYDIFTEKLGGGQTSVKIKKGGTLIRQDIVKTSDPLKAIVDTTSKSRGVLFREQILDKPTSKIGTYERVITQASGFRKTPSRTRSITEELGLTTRTEAKSITKATDQVFREIEGAGIIDTKTGKGRLLTKESVTLETQKPEFVFGKVDLLKDITSISPTKTGIKISQTVQPRTITAGTQYQFGKGQYQYVDKLKGMGKKGQFGTTELLQETKPKVGVERARVQGSTTFRPGIGETLKGLKLPKEKALFELKRLSGQRGSQLSATTLLSKSKVQSGLMTKQKTELKGLTQPTTRVITKTIPRLDVTARTTPATLLRTKTIPRLDVRTATSPLLGTPSTSITSTGRRTKTPFVPIPKLTIFSPKFKSFLPNKFIKSSKKSSLLSTKYVSDVKSSLLGIYGKKPTGVYGGLRTRPLLRRRKTK